MLKIMLPSRHLSCYLIGMPRTARLDIVGLLQHVMVRGIEKRDIFVDDADRERFLSRLSKLLQETETDCLAWALLPNHFHLLLRPRRRKLADFMRRLLTGYAIYFNLRHERAGHLFQNRYKSILCEEDPYLIELVRYIHLNPFRAGLVKDLDELDHYRGCGHAVLMGTCQLPGQNTDEVLAYWGSRIFEARQKYRKFVAEGMERETKEDLGGGDPVRRFTLIQPKETETHDLRILGSGDFVEKLQQTNRLPDRPAIKVPLEILARKICDGLGVRHEALMQRLKTPKVTEARSVISYIAVREMGYSGTSVGTVLGIGRSAVSVAASRGEALLRSNPSLRDRLAI